MDYIAVLKDSIATSVSLEIFLSKNTATLAHIYNAKLIKMPMSICKNKLDNFDPSRLQSSAIKAYPKTNRPRGEKDISSVNYYIKQINQNQPIPAIWIIKKDNQYTLLDGAHRIVANYICNKKNISAYVVFIPEEKNILASGRNPLLQQIIHNTNILKSISNKLE